MKGYMILIVLLVILSACGTNRVAFSPSKKFAPRDLQKDYNIYQHLLEEAHPGLYWYTNKESMDQYFNWGRSQLNDSLTEPQFRKVLTYVTSKINCGHTSVRSSRRYSHYLDTVRINRMFPLSLKIWNNHPDISPDTAVIAANLNRRDSVLIRGTMVTAINGRSIREITDTLFNYISTDGYNKTHKYQSLSNRGFFGSLFTACFGLQEQYKIDYIDSTGNPKSIVIRNYNPVSDTFARAQLRAMRQLPQPSRKERRERQQNSVRLLKIDSVNHVAMMDLSSFGRGYGLQRFFRRSFRALEKNKIDHLVVDVRGNGGGSVTNSTMITRYIAHQRFKVADSLYAIAKRKRYGRYIRNDFFNRLFMTFFTKKRPDGYYHFRYFERHYFKPKERHHFDGQVYILIGGNSFSATTLFATALIKQDNVTVIGEETGGGSYGNSAWLIPDVTLPNTRVRFRLPLFRLVMNKGTSKTGRGVQPEIESGPTVDAIKNGMDYKLEKAMELIKRDKEINGQVHSGN
jgi:hypothetical protein